jgi:hypothetical protein
MPKLKLLQWLAHDDVARTNAAQASVRLQHGRRDRDDANAFLAQHRRDHEDPSRMDVATEGRTDHVVSPPSGP